MKPGVAYRQYKDSPKLTAKIDLPGQQARVRELILYISKKCALSDWYGLTKLNKILWKSDFDAFATRGVPVTGRAYQRLERGPAPKEMVPILRSMFQDSLIRYETTDFGDGVVEKRPVPLAEANTSRFTEEDLGFVDSAISYYWRKTGLETSDDSHGVAWKSRSNGDLMYYELALLSDAEISPRHRITILEKAKKAAPKPRQ